MEGREEGRVNACEIIKCVKYLVCDRVSDLTNFFYCSKIMFVHDTEIVRSLSPSIIIIITTIIISF